MGAGAAKRAQISENLRGSGVFFRNFSPGGPRWTAGVPLESRWNRYRWNAVGISLLLVFLHIKLTVGALLLETDVRWNPVGMPLEARWRPLGGVSDVRASDFAPPSRRRLAFVSTRGHALSSKWVFFCISGGSQPLVPPLEPRQIQWAVERSEAVLVVVSHGGTVAARGGGMEM